MRTRIKWIFAIHFIYSAVLSLFSAMFLITIMDVEMHDELVAIEREKSAIDACMRLTVNESAVSHFTCHYFLSWL